MLNLRSPRKKWVIRIKQGRRIQTHVWTSIREKGICIDGAPLFEIQMHRQIEWIGSLCSRPAFNPHPCQDSSMHRVETWSKTVKVPRI